MFSRASGLSHLSILRHRNLFLARFVAHCVHERRRLHRREVKVLRRYVWGRIKVLGKVLNRRTDGGANIGYGALLEDVAGEEEGECEE